MQRRRSSQILAHKSEDPILSYCVSGTTVGAKVLQQREMKAIFTCGGDHVIEATLSAKCDMFEAPYEEFETK